MRSLTVVGLSEDRASVVLRAGAETFELALADVRQAERAAAPATLEVGSGGLSPRDIQQRIRRGESAAGIAEAAGVPLAAVQRYEGPVLAEREHQARLVQRALVDGRVVGDLVREHLTRLAPGAAVTWDCWLTDSGRWDVQVRADREVVRLRWDALNRRVQAVDEIGRQALLLAPAAEDALGAVLRPVARRGAATQPGASTAQAAGPQAAGRQAAGPQGTGQEAALPGTAGRETAGQAELPLGRPVVRPRGRAEVPSWNDIATEVAGRPRGGVPAAEPER